MMVALIPLFDENMAVRAYSVFAQKDNFLLKPNRLGTGQFDGAGSIEGLEVIQSIGMETISSDKELFIPVNNVSIFTDIEGQCKALKGQIVLMIDNTFPPIEMYVNRLKKLKSAGYKLAMRKVQVNMMESHRSIIELVDYVLLNSQRIAMNKAKMYFDQVYPSVQLCASNIDTMEMFETVKEFKSCYLYEGPFYRLPVTKGETEVAPIKMNYIALLNIVNEVDFDLTKAADVIGRDAALTISLLKMVNRMTINSQIKSIRHAAAMLGQRDLKKWINTAVVNEMYADKPNEITRLSLLRAKFAENLAGVFGMETQKEELFLMGLFSVLDIILEKSMEDALKLVKVSNNIEKALINNEGPFAELLQFMIQYESANWQEVSRQLILLNLSHDDVYKAYFETLKWYRNLTKA